MQYNSQANSIGIDNGKLIIHVTSKDKQIPVSNAQVAIASSGIPDDTLEIVETNSDGETGNIFLDAPPLEFSMDPTDNQPYSEYNIKISAEGYNEIIISGVQIFPGQTAIQEIQLSSVTESISNNYNPSVIPGHTLWEYYPPKIAEDEIKSIPETGEIVLSRVVVPETIIVHDGTPTDTTATNYYVNYKEYVKNVASCEVYATWPEETLIANIHAIVSFTLNRVYTEWYQNHHFFVRILIITYLI